MSNSSSKWAMLAIRTVLTPIASLYYLVENVFFDRVGWVEFEIAQYMSFEVKI